jgi:hypothetical protein
MLSVEIGREQLHASGRERPADLLPGCCVGEFERATSRLNARGGAGTLDDLIQLYIGWARTWVALLDSDKAGRSQAERYVAKFGRIVERRILLLADVSGQADARGIESLLTDSDHMAFQQVVDPAATEYNKKPLALGVQEVLVSGVRVALTQTAAKSLDAVLGTLRSRLAS